MQLFFAAGFLPFDGEDTVAHIRNEAENPARRLNFYSDSSPTLILAQLISRYVLLLPEHSQSQRTLPSTCANLLTLDIRSTFFSNWQKLADFFFAKFMRGCEDNCYGRMVIREDDIDGLSFDNDHPLTPAGVDLPENYDLCHRPTDESLNGLFDVTVKAVSFHKDCGPAVVTIAHQEPLQLISSRHELDNGCVETLGAVRYHFKSGELKNEDGASFTIAASFKNCAKLLNFDPLEFEEGMVIAQRGERPTSNQLWVLDWKFAVLEGDRSTEHCIGIWENKPKVSLARSEISRKCGLIKGL